jgi:hypothetical protein
MNLGEMVDQAFVHIQDSARSYIREDSVIGWLNEAMFDLDARYRVTVKQATGTFTDNTITLPTGVLDIDFLRVGSQSVDTDFLTDTDFNLLAYGTSQPTISVARRYGTTVEVYPTPDVGTAWTLRYLGEPTALADNADVPALPTVLHRKMVLFAASEALFQEGNYELGGMKRSDYESDLPMAPAAILRRKEGMASMSLRFGPYDTNDAAHI